MKKMITISVVVLALAVGAYLCLNCGPGCESNTTDTSSELKVDKGCGDSGCGSACTNGDNEKMLTESTVCGGCGENSCTKECSTNPANDTTDLKSLVPSCSLSNAELHERKEELRASVVAKINRIQELPTGYDLIFIESKEYSNDLLEFINFERGCCSSFTYALIFEPNNKATHLQIYGSAAIKEELKEGFGALGIVR